jgi:D-arabinose 1-dehydrogenase-like Zn-dependent alcohol dehydrogenase
VSAFLVCKYVCSVQVYRCCCGITGANKVSQFAKAAGAKVIATTSSPEKAEKLKQLGADHVINYKEDPNWGETAKKLTPGGEGVHHVIEVGGPQTVAQVSHIPYGATANPGTLKRQL